MTARRSGTVLRAVGFLVALACASCGREAGAPPLSGEDGNVTTLGTIEVTARLVEVPGGAIFKRDLYNYATVLKYEVLRVHRGTVAGKTIYVGHYNPFKPREEAADRRVPGVGGNVRAFQAGDVHRMALEASIDDHYMGGIVNKYFGRDTGPILWALWTNLASE